MLIVGSLWKTSSFRIGNTNFDTITLVGSGTSLSAVSSTRHHQSRAHDTAVFSTLAFVTLSQLGNTECLGIKEGDIM